MAQLLVVDDELFNLMMIEELLAGSHSLVTARDGLEAWRRLDSSPAQFDAVILDRRMPGMDGMETLRRIRQDARFQLTPVIMQTAACTPGEVAEGLAAGAWYYLAKPYDGVALVNIVKSALADRTIHLELDRLDTDIKGVLAMTCAARYRFRTPLEARRLAAMLGRLCPDHGGVTLGLAELMLNAVEHGNLGIGYAEKGALIASDTWLEEVERRLAAPEYRDCQAELEFVRENDELRFTIRDQGAGFEWRNYLEMDPARAFDAHGRGIALARQQAFAALDYQGSGNVVTTTIQLKQESQP